MMPSSPSPTLPGTSAGAGLPVRPVLVILALGLLVRLLLWGWFAGLTPQIDDEKDYDQLAHNLVEHGEYAYSPGRPATLRPPLYPFAVAGIYGVCGLHNYQAVRFFQALLSLVTAWIIMRLAAEAFSPRVGLWAGALTAFYPSLLGMNCLILTETLFTFWLCAAVFAFWRAFDRQSLGWFLMAGILVGLGALTRSILWLWPPTFAVFFLLVGGMPWMRRLLSILLLCLGFAATIAPWSIRCTTIEETFVPIDTMGGRNFMMGNYRYTPLFRSWDAISLQGEKAWHHEVHTTHPKAERNTQGKVDKLALKQGLQFVKENPGLTLQRDFVKFIQFWGLERELVAGAARGYFGAIPRWATLAIAVVIVGSYVAALLAGIFGLVMLLPSNLRFHGMIWLLFAFICGLHTLVFAHSRYHLPLIPLLLIYAAQAWVCRSQIWRRRRSWSFAVAACMCLFFVAAWCWEVFYVEWDRWQNAL